MSEEEEAVAEEVDVEADLVAKTGDIRRKLSMYIKRWSRYPLSFPIEACNAEKFGYPTHQQAHMFSLLPYHRYLAVHSGHNIGKTRFLAWEFWRHIICFKRPGFPLKIPVTGPSGGNLSDVVWSEIALVKGHLPEWLGDLFVLNNERLYCAEGKEDSWFGVIRTARKDNPDALQGFHACKFIIDEGSGVDDDVFEVAQGAFAEDDSTGLMFGNPTRLNGYFHKACNSKTLWHSVHLSSEDTCSSTWYEYPYVKPDGTAIKIKVKGRCSQKWLDQMKHDWGEESNVYKVRVQGIFPVEGETDQVIKNIWVADARALLDPYRGDFKHSPIMMGVDVAYTGEDDSAVCTRQGRNIIDIEGIRGNDSDEVSDTVIRRYEALKEIDREPRWILVDVTGIGWDVYRALIRKGYKNAIPVLAQAAAPDDAAKAKRIRDWLWWRARNFYKDRKPYWEGKGPEWDRLAKELCLPHVIYKGIHIYVEDKLEIKKRYNQKSPDYADAHNLTFYLDNGQHMAKARQMAKTADKPRRHKKPKAIPGSRWKVL